VATEGSKMVVNDKHLIERFGDNYSLYMRKVPRMNLILGIMRFCKNLRGR